MKKRASAPGLPLARLDERQIDQLKEPAARTLCGPPKIQRTRQRFEHGIERTDVAPEESTDNRRPIGAAAALDDDLRSRRSRHLPEEIQHCRGRQTGAR